MCDNNNNNNNNTVFFIYFIYLDTVARQEWMIFTLILTLCIYLSLGKPCLTFLSKKTLYYTKEVMCLMIAGGDTRIFFAMVTISVHNLKNMLDNGVCLALLYQNS
jgi:hypothetical protein